MKRRTQEQWHALFQAQATSGLTAAAFCQRQGVCPKYFSLRRRQLLGEILPGVARTAVSAFVPVAVTRPTEAAALDVWLGATLRLRVPTSVSPGWLAELLQTLRD